MNRKRLLTIAGIIGLLVAGWAFAHSRPHDYPTRDDENFMKHSITRWKDGAPELTYKDVRFTRFLPEERKY